MKKKKLTQVQRLEKDNKVRDKVTFLIHKQLQEFEKDLRQLQEVVKASRKTQQELKDEFEGKITDNTN